MRWLKVILQLIREYTFTIIYWVCGSEWMGDRKRAHTATHKEARDQRWGVGHPLPPHKSGSPYSGCGVLGGKGLYPLSHPANPND